ncbi:MAG: immunoglobulin domain-containing protein [Clostridia bacterium]|nr:immunoglobulin domain-containing protein [Clostridia bacterium]
MKHGFVRRMICMVLTVCVLLQTVPAGAANVAGTYADSLTVSAAELEATYLGSGLTLTSVRKAAGLESPVPLHAGQRVSAAMDAFQIGEWLDRFLDEDLARAMDHTVTVNRDLQLLDASEDPDCRTAAADFSPVGAETLTIEALQLEIGGYANALREARYEIDRLSGIAGSQTASWQEKARAYSKIREQYEVIRKITAVVTENHADWEARAAAAEQELHQAEDRLSAVGAPAGTAEDVLHADACVSVVRQAVREDKARSLGLSLQGSAGKDFTVLIVHGDEIAFNVYEEQPASEKDKKKTPLGGADVRIWGYDRKKKADIAGTAASALTDDTDKTRGSVVFKLSNFTMNDKNEFELCYSVAKEGYRAQAVLSRRATGGDIREIYLKKEDGQGGIAGILFANAECMYEQGQILCNISNKEKIRSQVLMGMVPGSGSLTVTVSYTDLTTNKPLSKAFEFKDLKVSGTELLTLDISDAWCSMFRYGTGDSVSVTVSGTWNGQTVSETVKPNLDLQIAKAQAPVLTDTGFDKLFDKFLNFHFDIKKSIGMGFDIGVDNPLNDFRVAVYDTVHGDVFFGIGGGATGVRDIDAQNKATYKELTPQDYELEKENWDEFRESMKIKKAAGDQEEGQPDKKNRIFGATFGANLTVCGGFEWLPTPTEGSVVRGTFEVLFTLHTDLSWTFRPIPEFPPFCIKLGLGFSVGFALKLSIYSKTNIKEDDRQAVEEAFSDYLGKKSLSGDTTLVGGFVIMLGVKFTVFGGVDVKWLTFGMEGWLEGALTLVVGDNWGGFKLDSVSLGGGVAVVLRFWLVSLKYTIVSGTIAKYPKDSPTLTSFGDAASDEADITPQTETGDSASRVTLDDSNMMGTIPAGGTSIKTASVSGKVYGFWLNGDGVSSMRLDNGADDAASSLKLSGSGGTDRVYDFAVAALEDQGLVAVAELIQDQWITEEITFEIEGEEPQKTETELPGAERTRMRLSFYTPGADGKLRPVANGDQSTTVTLSLGRDYYSAVDLCMTENGTEKKLGLCYWETDQNRVAMYTLPFTFASDTVNFVTPLVTDETTVTPAYKQFWNDTDCLGTAWFEYGSTQSLRCVFTDGRDLTAYALVLLDNEELQLPIRGEMTALVARAAAENGGTDTVIATTEIPATVSAALGSTGVFTVPYGILGINVRPDGRGHDFVTATCQVLDEANSTADSSCFDTGLTGIHISRTGGSLKVDGYEAYDVKGMEPNAVADFSFGTYMLYWIELFNPSGNQLSEEEKKTYDPESREYAYYRMRAMLYDQTNGLWTQPYTLAIMDRRDDMMPVDRNISGLTVFNDGAQSRVVILQDTKPASAGASGQEANVIAFTMREVMDLNFQNFVLETPAIKPGGDVSLFFTVYNDGNVPISGFKMSVTNTATGASLMDTEYSFTDPEAALTRVYTDTDSDGDGMGEILEQKGYAAVAAYTGMFDDDSASYWLTESADASGKRELRTASTRYLMPGKSKSFTAVFSVPNTEDHSVDLRATLTSLSTQAIRLRGTDGTEALSAMAAWGTDLRGWEAGAPAPLRSGNTVTVTMDMAPGLQDADRRHAVRFGTVPASSGTLQAGTSVTAVLGMAEGTEITPVYSVSDGGMLPANSGTDLFSRFAKTTELEVAKTAYNGVDLDLEAVLRTNADGTESVHMTLRNNAMVPAKNIVIRAYAASEDIPTYTVPLGKDFVLDETWTAVLDLPLETLTAGMKSDALILRVSSDGTEALEANNETILNTNDLFRITEQPQSQTVKEGTAVSFTVSARGGVKPYTWQWQTCRPGSSAWTNIDGAAGSTLTIDRAALADSGRLFRCVAVDAAGSRVVSENACLTVEKVPVPPLTGDPADLTGWLTAFLLACVLLIRLCERRRERAK